MKHTILKCLGFAVIIATLFSSCKDDKFDTDENDLGDGGKTIVKFLEGPKNEIFFSPFTTIKKVDLFSLRRDANSSASLQAGAKVKLTETTAATVAAGTYAGYEALPASIYTFVANSTIVKTATGYEFNFQPGESAKELTINLNGALYDLNKKYLLSFDITNAGSGAEITKQTSKSIVVMISIKNKYDGVYSVSGTLNDVASPTISHFSNFINSAANVYTTPPFKLELRTVSATKCAAYDAEFFGDGTNAYQMPITSGTTYSRYGSFGIIIEFDPATDKVIGVTNYYGQPASNTRSAQLDPSGINKWVSGTMNIKYNMLQPSVVAGIRATWTEEWKYLGARK